MAVQYAKAMGLNVAAVDVDDAKLDLAKRLGAAVTVNAKTSDPVAEIKKVIGGAHGDWSRRYHRRRSSRRSAWSVAAHGFAHRPTPRAVPAGHLWHGAQRHHGARLNRRHPPGPAGMLDFAAYGKVRATVTTDKLEHITMCLRAWVKARLKAAWCLISPHNVGVFAIVGAIRLRNKIDNDLGAACGRWACRQSPSAAGLWAASNTD